MTPAATPSGDFQAEVEALCTRVAEAHKTALESEDEAELQDGLAEVSDAEAELVDALAELDPPDDLETAFSEYIDELARYADANRRLMDSYGDPPETLENAVASAESGVALEEAAAKADLPPECPPPPTINVHNTLFVAQVNRECFEVGVDLQVGGPIEMPETPKEVALVLDLGERVTAAIARAVRRAASPQVEGLPVKEILRASKKRFLALRNLRATFSDGNYREYRQAARRVRAVSEATDRLLLSAGLRECSKLFGLLPF